MDSHGEPMEPEIPMYAHLVHLLADESDFGECLPGDLVGVSRAGVDTELGSDAGVFKDLHMNFSRQIEECRHWGPESL